MTSLPAIVSVRMLKNFRSAGSWPSALWSTDIALGPWTWKR
jgi:hypothetical protein